MKGNDIPRRKGNLVKLLLAGVLFLCLSCIQLRKTWTSRLELSPITGALDSANVYLEKLTDKLGTSSNVSELVFYLDGFDRKYYLVEDIGDDLENKEYNTILYALKHADSITVWIKKAELNKHQPEVFSIEADGKTIFDSVKGFKNRPLIILFLLIGVAFILFSIADWNGKVTKWLKA